MYAQVQVIDLLVNDTIVLYLFRVLVDVVGVTMG